MSGRSPYLDTAPLAPGDTVALIAPSGPTDEESLQRAIARLESWGLHVLLGEHVRARHPRATYLAGTDDQRRADLVSAWCDPEVSAVIALRGGYGAMRLLDGIDFRRLREHALRADGRPKLLTGSSDITALHQAWEHHLAIPTLFCPMPGNDPFRDSSIVPAEVASWLFEPWAGRELGFPDSGEGAGGAPGGAGGEPGGGAGGPGSGAGGGADSHPDDLGPGPVSRPHTLVAGTATGRLFGGNLSLVAAGLGSPELVDVRHRARRCGPSIGLLEDVDEELYRLDNLLIQLVRSGWFDACSALVLGSWHSCAPLPDVEALVLEYLGDAGIPIVSELGFGHDPDAPSAPLGVVVRLDALAGARPRLTVED